VKIIIKFILLFVFTFTKALYSYGVGGYLSGGFGYQVIEKNLNIYSYPIDHNINNSINYSWGFGLIIDSNLSKNDILNYRFKIGYERLYADYKNNTSSFMYHSSHIFGCKIIRNDLFRLWIGPQIGINYYYLKNKIKNGFIIDPVYLITSNGMFKSNTIRFNFLNINSGIVIGSNFQFDNDFTLSIDISLLASFSTGYCDNFLIPHIFSFNSKKSICRTYGFDSRLTLSFLRRFNEVNI